MTKSIPGTERSATDASTFSTSWAVPSSLRASYAANSFDTDSLAPRKCTTSKEQQRHVKAWKNRGRVWDPFEELSFWHTSSSHLWYPIELKVFDSNKKSYSASVQDVRILYRRTVQNRPQAKRGEGEEGGVVLAWS